MRQPGKKKKTTKKKGKEQNRILAQLEPKVRAEEAKTREEQEERRKRKQKKKRKHESESREKIGGQLELLLLHVPLWPARFPPPGTARA